MSVPEKWWLISDVDVQVIREGLMSQKQLHSEGLMTRTLIERAETRQKALHVLESGLHKTEAIPDDFKKEAL